MFYNIYTLEDIEDTFGHSFVSFLDKRQAGVTSLIQINLIC